tara:strand:+ start:866 stop:1105 length:240 start_codon:yes stop_codon:yes gene_type:complete
MTDRDIKIAITLDTGSAELDLIRKSRFISEHVKKIAKIINELPDKSGKIIDVNGNTVGEWSLEGDTTDSERQMNEAWGV